MRRFVLNKLVRDRVFESMLELGQKPHYKTLDDKEFLTALKIKLFEEIDEFDPKKPNAIKELGDLLEVIEQIGKELGSDFKKIRQTQLSIRRTRGGFAKRIFVGELEVEDSDPWAAYYAAEPERFPEIKDIGDR